MFRIAFRARTMIAQGDSSPSEPCRARDAYGNPPKVAKKTLITSKSGRFQKSHFLREVCLDFFRNIQFSRKSIAMLTHHRMECTHATVAVSWCFGFFKVEKAMNFLWNFRIQRICNKIRKSRVNVACFFKKITIFFATFGSTNMPFRNLQTAIQDELNALSLLELDVLVQSV